jgi:hypothetical protein
MKQTIKNIIDFIRQNKGKSFINIYPYFGVIDENGILKDRIYIDNDYCYYFDCDNNKLCVQNYETEKSRIFKIN